MTSVQMFACPYVYVSVCSLENARTVSKSKYVVQEKGTYFVSKLIFVRYVIICQGDEQKNSHMFVIYKKLLLEIKKNQRMGLGTIFNTLYEIMLFYSVVKRGGQINIAPPPPFFYEQGKIQNLFDYYIIKYTIFTASLINF